ncbi:UDP-N-acetylglucosamine 1-carboxyvinyltransferase [Candidatus Falkowbacteria bacterium CG_4_10_14_0_2_um_filter_36_22]|uniref:UDP-N-acetylglucosamine 1-carboxyvinyltransferase n=1 Tax=Candidatus Falkowbacteria bacterium CG02_land_8_20_14_3_00_36_14 TaxID=1974560 RepID=A0A2M7DQN1_9BACT|nr:MAG: UDP-N-acetylglucosamine 1-carboxyvinyltransferase [Candidatus Falkowbacteria bacterium CG02_land_8_20_14_3_00_36_14]PJA10770.1 MAG: UDP-N-acetylglucosamine 1-carboxyvinyltransferase [Candidatus Falkowbacteria bacterium CG_4_10_14_0_2_um_filter_36_22]
MSKFIINGPAKLSGAIAVKGAKNSALKIIPAALLSRQKITINNLPNIEDVSRALELLEDLGGVIKRRNGACEIEINNLSKNELAPKFANKFRASIMFVGPLLARFGEVKFPHPGGCVIGAGTRPINLFLEGYKSLGAKITFKNGFYIIKTNQLKGCDYFFTTVSVTGTESLVMTAVLATGITILKNCAMEPEIVALADYLNRQGAKIKGAGTPTITITGVDKITAGEFNIIPDRIETGTFAIMAAATRSELTITKCNPAHIEALLTIFNKQGIEFTFGPDWIKILPAKNFLPYNIKTHEYPGFPTDLQSPFTVLMTQASGSSIIHETIYDRRLLFTDILSQMGADIIMCDPHRVVVNGPTKLSAKKITSLDIRAGIAVIIAALIAEGETEIDNIYQVDRGYEDIDGRLRSIGADIKRIGSLNL